MKKFALSLFVVAASGAYVMAQSGSVPATDAAGAGLPADSATTASIAAPVPDSTPGRPEPEVTPPASASPTPSGLPGDGGAVPAGAGPVALVAAGPASDPPASPGRIAASPSETPIKPGPGVSSSDPPPVVPVRSMTPASPADDDDLPDPAAAVVYISLPRPRPDYRVTHTSAAPIPPGAARRSGYADGTFTGPPVDAYYGLVQVQATVAAGRVVAVQVLRYPSDRRTSQFINRHALPVLREEVIQAQSAKVDIVSGATLTSRAFIRSLDAALKQAAA